MVSIAPSVVLPTESVNSATLAMDSIQLRELAHNALGTPGLMALLLANHAHKALVLLLV